jgi:hypothetical protein
MRGLGRTEILAAARVADDATSEYDGRLVLAVLVVEPNGAGGRRVRRSLEVHVGLPRAIVPDLATD